MLCHFLRRTLTIAYSCRGSRPSVRPYPPSLRTESSRASRRCFEGEGRKEGDRPACPRNEIREEGLKRIGGDSRVSYSTLEADCDGGDGDFFWHPGLVGQKWRARISFHCFARKGRGLASISLRTMVY